MEALGAGFWAGQLAEVLFQRGRATWRLLAPNGDHRSRTVERLEC
jgi:hypothetical protein